MTFCALWTHDGGGHTYGGAVWVEATCIVGGHYEYTCSVCGETRGEGYTAPLGHSYESKLQSATCTEHGCTVHTCIRCGDRYETDVTPALGHQMGDWVTDTAATCQKAGSRHRTCTHCSHREDGTVDVCGHDLVRETGKEATCTQQGERRYHCADCDFEATETTSMTGHSYEKQRVSLSYLRQLDADVLYTRDGDTGYCYVCVHCLQVLTAAQGGTTAASVQSSTCAHGSQSDWTVLCPAACGERGFEGITCLDCGEVLTVRVTEAAADHSYTAVVTAPTCTERGYTTYTCVCGESYVDNYVDATGHDHKLTASKAASCEADGYEKYVCSCGDSYTVTLSATGHDYGEWYVTKNASCLADGEERHDCATCGHSETRVVEKIACPSAKFSDVPADAWYHSYVDYVVERGLMNGTGGDKFAPTAVVTRATVAQMLYNMEGKPSTAGMSNPFSDVKQGDWYYDAVVWAANAGVVSGNGKGGFDPNNNVTREQLAIMLYNYTKAKGYDLKATKDVDLSSFVDGSKTSTWAASQLKWACDLGLIGGKSVGGVTYLAPQDTATRAEIATIFMRFYQMVENR